MEHLRTRKTIRLQGYDYSQPGEYFVTICTHEKVHSLGEVVNEEVRLTSLGEIVQKCWEQIPEYFPNVELDAFIVMPNHIHGIIIINESRRDLIYQIQPEAKLDVMNQDVMNHVPTEWMMMKNPKQTLGKIIRSFKAHASKMVHDAGYTDFQWQQRFYEHIIRDENDLANTRDYIVNNPITWFYDEEKESSKE